MTATSTEEIPDFAFPLTVEKESGERLEAALQSGDGIEALRNIMNLCISYNLLSDTENIAPDVVLLDSILPRLNGIYKNLGCLLEAEIYSQYYLGNRSKFDNRDLPLNEDYPADPAEWSGKMFKNKILSSVVSAGMTPNATEKLQKFSLLLKNCETAEKIGLSISDFIAFKGAAILWEIAGTGSMTEIPFYPESRTNRSVEGQCRMIAAELLGHVVGSSESSIVKALAMLRLMKMKPDFEQEKYLKDCFQKLNDTPGEGLLLYELWTLYSSEDNSYYAEIKDWLKKYPKEYGSERLKYALSEITKERIETTFPTSALPGKTIKGVANVTNMNKGYILVYRLATGEYDSYDNIILKKFSKNSKPVETIKLESDGNIPFSSTQEITIKGLPAGLYVIVASSTPSSPKDFGIASSDSHYSTIRVSEITLVTSCNTNEQNSGRVYVVKASNQEPVAGAIVTYYTGASTQPKGKLTTNNEGWVSVPSGYYRIEAIKGENVAKGEAGFGYYKEGNAGTLHTSLLSDLGVYRPGDTVRYAIVGWREDKYSNSIVKNEKVAISFRDANYIEVGKDTLLLNNDGRASGKFVVPEGRLLGQYQLTSNFVEHKGTVGGSVSFQVEEYKLPSFLVTLNQDKSIDDETLDFSGLAATFSGMPIAAADVIFKIEYRPWRWWGSGGDVNYTQTTKTDKEGKFTITLPTGNLKGTVFERGRYVVTAEVTAPEGDTQLSSPLVFYLGKVSEIRPEIPDKVEVEGDSINLKVPVLDISGQKTLTELNYKLINLSDTTQVMTGRFESPVLSITATALKSGRYRIEFSEGDDNNPVSTEFVVWRKGDKTAPYPTALWVPETEYFYDPTERKVDITFGSYWESWILYTLSDGENILTREWISPVDGLTHKTVEIPHNLNTLFVTLGGLHDFQGETERIKIASKESLEKMEIKTVSFRDKVSAGDKEEWKFKIRVGENNAAYANVLAVMSDKALNSIWNFKWNLNIRQHDIYDRVRITEPYLRQTSSYKTFSPLVRRIYTNLDETIPEWETYGYPFVNFRMFGGGKVLYRSMATKNAMTSGKMEVEDAVMESSMERPQAAVMDMAEEEGNFTETDKEFSLRPVEMPLAFFKPDLKADDSGLVTVDFEVPDFNTTWQFQLAAYNEKMQNATVILDTEVSKPVMVKTNLPQYLRTGDKAEINASFYNNTDTNLDVAGKIEVIDGATMRVLKEATYEPVSVYPFENRLVNVSFDVPVNTVSLIIRTYATGGNHRDGEQGLVAVLPSSSPVISAETFYATTEQELLEINIPRLNPDANVTLKYCDNPLWEVLLSLPGMEEGSNSSALGLAQWLYAAQTGIGIISNHPDIAKGLEEILSSKDLAKGHLESDSNLKITTLVETPWINDAASETARIRSLEKFLDPSSLKPMIEEKTVSLSKLQQSDGGWVWFDGMKSSPYITSQVISIMGYLHSHGLLDQRLIPMAKKGIGFYDRWIVENYDKYKILNIAALTDYLYSRNMIETPMSAKMRKIADMVKDSISTHWRYWDPGQKAKAGLVLLADKRYQKEALIISSSLEEFTGKRLPIYQEALLLELFKKANGSKEAIEKVMENLYLQKETQDWGREIYSAGVIYTMVEMAGSDSVVRELPEIYIDGKPVALPASMSLTGNYTINLTPRDVSGKRLVIKRNAGLPVWGGVVSQYVAPIKEIKKESVENLSIEKRIFKKDSAGELKETNVFSQGDELVVVLNLTVGKDMDYIVISDARSACLQPDEKTSGLTLKDGLLAYREVKASKTNFFIETVPAGKSVISYDCHADRGGVYSMGMSEVQCLYSPAQVAHSGGSFIKIE